MPSTLLIEYGLGPAEFGLARQERLAEAVAQDELPRLFAWRASSTLVVARRDTELPNFATAAAVLAADGWPVLARPSGGGACPIGAGTLQLFRAAPAAVAGSIDDAYRNMAGTVLALLAACGLTAHIGRIANTYCPGRYDIAFNRRKLCGISQSWRRHGGAMVASVAASINVEAAPANLAATVNCFYELAGSPERCTVESATSVGLALGEQAPADRSLIVELLDRLPAIADHASPWSP